MQLIINKIILTKDIRKEKKLPVEEGNTDVIVTMENGDLFIASFFAYLGIQLLTKTHQSTGEFLEGKYFWAKGMLLIDSCDRKSIENVIDYLLDEGDFLTVFQKL